MKVPLFSSTPLSKAKAALRQEVRERVQNISILERTVASDKICARLQEREVWRQATSVLLFSPLPDCGCYSRIALMRRIPADEDSSLVILKCFLPSAS